MAIEWIRSIINGINKSCRHSFCNWNGESMDMKQSIQIYYIIPILFPQTSSLLNRRILLTFYNAVQSAKIFGEELRRCTSEFWNTAILLRDFQRIVDNNAAPLNSTCVVPVARWFVFKNGPFAIQISTRRLKKAKKLLFGFEGMAKLTNITPLEI